jgi:hypothetical protein
MKQLFFALALCSMLPGLKATKLAEVKVVDKEYLMIHFKDGEVFFRDQGKGSTAFGVHGHDSKNNYTILYGSALDTLLSRLPASWTLSSGNDPAYQGNGRNPLACYRKSKLNGMAEMDWMGTDYKYEITREHFIYLHLPEGLKQGLQYSLNLSAGLGSDRLRVDFKYDIFNCPTEALHLNLTGYPVKASIKAADLYLWMGDGGARDYSSFEGKKVLIYDTLNKKSYEAGKVRFWKKNAPEANKYNLINSDVWTVDFTGFQRPGTYRLVVEDVGCSEDFTIGDQVYHDPFMVSVRGFFYMRIGQDSAGIRPIPRRPLYIPGKSPEDTKVILTSMHPLHPKWRSFSSGDQWDKPRDWEAYVLPGRPENPNAFGGHSDALDWDRHLGHVSIIWDMLLPFVLTNGALMDDDLGIAESGNGIPDLLDEARNEVDFWLRLREGRGYAHGVTNPTENNILYQAGATPLAAWASAANSAILAYCFKLANLRELAQTYTDSSIAAFRFADALAGNTLTTGQDIGDGRVRGFDMKMMAVAYLYNITGDKAWEDIMYNESEISTDSSLISGKDRNLLWSVAAYLLSKQAIHYPALYNHMKASVIHEALKMETNFSGTRPSRRASDEEKGYFKTEQNVHRTMLAHVLCPPGPDRDLFENALLLEAGWGLGRNPLNMIQMTTASTPLEKFRSVENIYTAGRDDGTPGLHPGHTPYLNTDDWGSGMVMHRPSWMLNFCYPPFAGWPKAEGYFNTRYVWSHSEFTPQQTMRGKMALYGYLYGLRK